MAAKPHSVTSDVVHREWELRIQCPECCSFLGLLRQSDFPPEFLLSCRTCYFQMMNEDGIWNALSPVRKAHFERFMQEYTTVREAEGRGSTDPEYYLALPYEDLSGHNREQWKIRARTFDYFQNRILPAIEAQISRSLDILDLGAGNGWMSYRLGLRKHHPVAVDLLATPLDGLAAAPNYRQKVPLLFPRFQADLDHLPFSNNQFDVAIFNASFHYSENYAETLGEAIRCLRRGGTVIITDTAWYKRDESGQQMLAERQMTFKQRYGFASDAIGSLEYLTDARLAALERRFGLRWETHSPSYGWAWAMRPVVAKLKGKRDPSRFRIYVAEVSK